MVALFSYQEICPGVVSIQISLEADPYYRVGYAQQLVEALQRIASNDSTKVVLLEGTPRYFSAGASREALLSVEPWSFFQTSRELVQLPLPTIAVMAGHAVGGGLIMGLWCDLVLMAEESMYGANFMSMGFTPGMGATAILPEVLGPILATDLLFTGRLVKGREIKASGSPLAGTVLPKTQVRARALELAQEIALSPRPALILLKQRLAERRLALLEPALAAETAMQKTLFADDVTRQRVSQLYPMPNSERPVS